MTNTLVAFLNARLDEDEAAAKAASEEFGVSGRWYRPEDAGKADLGIHGAQWAHIARHDPARVLREVEAGRALMKRYERGTAGELPEWKAGRELIEAALAILLGVLRDLAAVYSDHRDYRQEWAP